VVEEKMTNTYGTNQEADTRDSIMMMMIIIIMLLLLMMMMMLTTKISFRVF